MKHCPPSTCGGRKQQQQSWWAYIDDGRPLRAKWEGSHHRYSSWMAFSTGTPLFGLDLVNLSTGHKGLPLLLSSSYLHATWDPPLDTNVACSCLGIRDERPFVTIHFKASKTHWTRLTRKRTEFDLKCQKDEMNFCIRGTGARVVKSNRGYGERMQLLPSSNSSWQAAQLKIKTTRAKLCWDSWRCATGQRKRHSASCNCQQLFAVLWEKKKGENTFFSSPALNMDPLHAVVSSPVVVGWSYICPLLL